MSTTSNETLLYLRKGLLENLKKAPPTPGALSFTTDEHAIYLDLEDGKRIRFGDIVQVETYAELMTLANPSTIAFYYAADVNTFLKYTLTDGWIPIAGGSSGGGSGDSGSDMSDALTVLNTKLNGIETGMATLSSNITTNADNIAAEKTRAEGAETALGTAIAQEKSRAESAEQTLLTKIGEVNTNYANADAALKTEITAEYQQYVIDNLSVADAMHFKGEASDTVPLPTAGVEAGDTYKVTGQFAIGNKTYYIGDLLIAESDQGETDSTYQGNWIHVPSGYESSYDAQLQGNTTDKAFTLFNGVGAQRGKVVFEDTYDAVSGGMQFTVSNVDTPTGDSITISASMIWGSFDEGESN